MITYGEGSVLYDGVSSGFEIRYTGTIRIIAKPDNLFIVANRNKIKGIMLDKSDLPDELFKYIGNLRIRYVATNQSGVMDKEKMQLQGVDYWELDLQAWEDDTSLWGSDGGTYTVGSPQRYNEHNLVVNKNIKVQYNGQFYYPDSSPVSENTLIHIHGDGVVMSGGVHTKESVVLNKTIKKDIKDIKIPTVTSSVVSGQSRSSY